MNKIKLLVIPLLIVGISWGIISQLKPEITATNVTTDDSCFFEVYAETDNIGFRIRLLNLTVSGERTECGHLREACKKREPGGLFDNLTKADCKWRPNVMGNDNKTYMMCSCTF